MTVGSLQVDAISDMLLSKAARLKPSISSRE
jgi:hypothetical protein